MLRSSCTCDADTTVTAAHLSPALAHKLGVIVQAAEGTPWELLMCRHLWALVALCDCCHDLQRTQSAFSCNLQCMQFAVSLLCIWCLTNQTWGMRQVDSFQMRLKIQGDAAEACCTWAGR